MIFITEISEVKPLNIFNNHVVRFEQDVVTFPDYATITIDSQVFYVYPNASGSFYFNFKEVFTTIFNQDGFVDELVVDNEEVLYEDEDLFKSYEVNFALFEVGGGETAETSTKTYKLIKGADQLEDERIGEVIVDGTEISILSPFTDNELNKHITYFEGYPLDISIYSKTARTVTFENNGDNYETIPEMDLIAGVNRLFIDFGEDNIDSLGDLALTNGVNRINIVTTEGEIETIDYFYINKIPNACGTYLKWFNIEGGWSYFLFNSNVRTLESKSLGMISKDFESLENIDKQNELIGKTSQEGLTLFSQGLDKRQNALVSNIIDSPQVFRFIGTKGVNAVLNDFISEEVVSDEFLIVESSKNKYDVQIELAKNPKTNQVI